jgi:hypothetical protein
MARTNVCNLRRKNNQVAALNTINTVMEGKVQKMSKTTTVFSLGKQLEETLFPIAMFLESVQARNIVSRNKKIIANLTTKQ